MNVLKYMQRKATSLALHWMSILIHNNWLILTQLLQLANFTLALKLTKSWLCCPSETWFYSSDCLEKFQPSHQLAGGLVFFLVYLSAALSRLTSTCPSIFTAKASESKSFLLTSTIELRVHLLVNIMMIPLSYGADWTPKVTRLKGQLPFKSWLPWKFNRWSLWGHIAIILSSCSFFLLQPGQKVLLDQPWVLRVFLCLLWCDIARSERRGSLPHISTGNCIEVGTWHVSVMKQVYNNLFLLSNLDKIGTVLFLNRQPESMWGHCR